jgi:uncharacterized membrane protein
MIAVALIPPAAVVGIGVAWGEPTLALGSAVLVLVNVLSINLAALAVLWYQGYRPEFWYREDQVRTATLTRIAILAGVILVLSVFLGGVTYAGYQGAVAEERIADTSDSVVAEHDGLQVLEITYEDDSDPLTGRPDHVVITIGKPAGTASPDIAATLERRIRDRVGYDVGVSVRFVEVQRAD